MLAPSTTAHDGVSGGLLAAFNALDRNADGFVDRSHLPSSSFPWPPLLILPLASPLSPLSWHPPPHQPVGFLGFIRRSELAALVRSLGATEGEVDDVVRANTVD